MKPQKSPTTAKKIAKKTPQSSTRSVAKAPSKAKRASSSKAVPPQKPLRDRLPPTESVATPPGGDSRPIKAKAPKENVFASLEANMHFWQDLMAQVTQTLADESAKKAFQQKLAQLMQDLPKGFAQPDARLNAPSWQSDPFYAQMTQMYAYQAALLERMIAALPLADAEARRKVNFLGRQMIEAMSPANFAWSNPEFINKALQTQGESLMEGMKHLISDVQKGRITHVDESQFEVGRNLACTAGKVVLQTPLYELIEYAPQTPTVSKRPMLFVPPCINKFYIMDLSPENSLVRYAVEQGHHLYLISWRNIDAQTQWVEWDHYIGAVISAINFVREDNRGENCNILGFCVGGTILSTTLAVMAAKGLQLPHSLTLLTTLLDFAEPGDLGVFLSESLLGELETMSPLGGIVPGSALAQVFSTLRPRDLIWNYVTQKYLKGEKPKDFDILYWNSDSTNQAVRMIAWYLRHCYWNNELVKKQAVVLGETVDLGKINIPTYFYASREDHIVPWQSAFASAKACGTNAQQKRFVLGASGHIAGVINPAKTNKRNYWIGAYPNATTSANDWFTQATEKPGSWWSDWSTWLSAHKGGEVASAHLRFEQKKSVYPAPGEYVKVRVDSEPLDQVINPLQQWLKLWTIPLQK